MFEFIRYKIKYKYLKLTGLINTLVAKLIDFN